MGKIIAKVLYAAFGVILAFLVYVITYNSGATTNYYNLLSDAAESGETEKVVKAFSAYEIPFDAEPTFTSGTEKNNVVVYNAINQLNLSYYPDNKEKTYAEIQFMYYFFIFDPTFNYGTKNDSDNLSGIRFYGNDDYYDFYYVASEDVNGDIYQSKPQTTEDAILYSARDMATTYSDYGFIFTAVSELFVNAIKNNATTKNGATGLGDITGFDILDNSGNVVDLNTSDTETGFTGSLDFSQQFFTDMVDFKYYSRVAINGEDEVATINGEEVTYKYADADEYLTDFSDSFDENYSTYSKGYAKSLVYNNKLVMSSVGLTALFVVLLVILYVIIFYFKKIKSLIFRDHRRQTQRIVPNKPVNNNQKTQFDKVNEQRAKDLSKQRAKEAEEKAAKEARAAEIRERGNAILANNSNQENNNENNPVEENNNTNTEVLEQSIDISDSTVSDDTQDDNNTTNDLLDQPIDIAANIISDDETKE